MLRTVRDEIVIAPEEEFRVAPEPAIKKLVQADIIHSPESAELFDQITNLNHIACVIRD